ncbi:MAG: O-phospho-L-seryl-tRNA:Cys-tRNA synthase [Euryarchaeota archaeon]|nr:O-phospho-L-seryl-tRNA:Cys-tRNA synthase [Euryarchaeota archaeon]
MKAVRNRYRDSIVINPLMRGGMIPRGVREELCRDWMRTGYETCHDCLEGRSGLIRNPPITEFLAEVAEFFGGDVAEHTFGCRAAQFTVMRAVASQAEGRTVIADATCHYTTMISAEMCGLQVVEVPHSGYPEYRINPEDYGEKIREVRQETGTDPALVVATHADPYYGNIIDVAEVGRVCSEAGVPFMVNAAYTGGVMPIDMKRMNIDFLSLSAHKSMASLSPLGYVVTSYQYSKKLFETSKIRPAWSGRLFGKKVPNLFGCGIGGQPLISSMLAFPYVKERVKGWDGELDKTRRFADEMEKECDMVLMGDLPHNHHLLHFETPLFWEISRTHKKKGFFLASEMVKRGIVGLHRGLTKHVKMSVYGLTEEEVRRVAEAFMEVAEAGRGREQDAGEKPSARAG